MWIQFFTFTWACWFIKFSLLAFYWRLFYLYTPLAGVSDGSSAMKKTIWATGIFLVVSLAVVLM